MGKPSLYVRAAFSVTILRAYSWVKSLKGSDLFRKAKSSQQPSEGDLGGCQNCQVWNPKPRAVLAYLAAERAGAARASRVVDGRSVDHGFAGQVKPISAVSNKAMALVKKVSRRSASSVWPQASNKPQTVQRPKLVNAFPEKLQMRRVRTSLYAARVDVLHQLHPSYRDNRSATFGQGHIACSKVMATCNIFQPAISNFLLAGTVHSAGQQRHGSASKRGRPAAAFREAPATSVP
jgi:hypothetical protein